MNNDYMNQNDDSVNMMNTSSSMQNMAQNDYYNNDAYYSNDNYTSNYSDTTYEEVSDISVKYCPLSYVTTVLRSTNADLTEGDDATNLQNLMKALYLYYQAAVDYNTQG